MKLYRRGFYFLLVVFLIITISGCGVSEDEHEQILAELEKTKAELSQALSKIEELTGADKAGSNIEGKLRQAQEKAGELAAKLKDMTSQNSELKARIDKMQEMIEDFQQQLGAVTDKTKGLPKDLFGGD